MHLQNEEKMLEIQDWVGRKQWRNHVNNTSLQKITNFPSPVSIQYSKLSVNQAQSISLTFVGTGPKAL